MLAKGRLQGANPCPFLGPTQVLDEGSLLSDLGITIRKRLVERTKGLRLLGTNSIMLDEEVGVVMRLHSGSRQGAHLVTGYLSEQCSCAACSFKQPSPQAGHEPPDSHYPKLTQPPHSAHNNNRTLRTSTTAMGPTSWPQP